VFQKDKTGSDGGQFSIVIFVILIRIQQQPGSGSDPDSATAWIWIETWFSEIPGSGLYYVNMDLKHWVKALG
jgi:hypothetical protein